MFVLEFFDTDTSYPTVPNKMLLTPFHDNKIRIPRKVFLPSGENIAHLIWVYYFGYDFFEISQTVKTKSFIKTIKANLDVRPNKPLPGIVVIVCPVGLIEEIIYSYTEPCKEFEEVLDIMSESEKYDEYINSRYDGYLIQASTEDKIFKNKEGCQIELSNPYILS